MSHYERGASVLTALLSFAVFATAAYGVYELIPSAPASQTASATLAMESGDTALSATTEAEAKPKAELSGDAACKAPIELQQDKNASVKFDATQDVLNTCVPGCLYKIGESSGNTVVKAHDRCAPGTRGTPACKATRCEVQLCNESGECEPVAASAASGVLSSTMGVKSEIQIKASPDLQKALEQAKTGSLDAYQQLPPYLQETFRGVQQEQIQTNTAAIQNNLDAIREMGESAPAARERLEADTARLQLENQNLARVSTAFGGESSLTPNTAPQPITHYDSVDYEGTQEKSANTFMSPQEQAGFQEVNQSPQTFDYNTENCEDYSGCHYTLPKAEWNPNIHKTDYDPDADLPSGMIRYSNGTCAMASAGGGDAPQAVPCPPADSNPVNLGANNCAATNACLGTVPLSVWKPLEYSEEDYTQPPRPLLAEQAVQHELAEVQSPDGARGNVAAHFGPCGSAAGAIDGECPQKSPDSISQESERTRYAALEPGRALSRTEMERMALLNDANSNFQTGELVLSDPAESAEYNDLLTRYSTYGTQDQAPGPLFKSDNERLRELSLKEDGRTVSETAEMWTLNAQKSGIGNDLNIESINPNGEIKRGNITVENLLPTADTPTPSHLGAVWEPPIDTPAREAFTPAPTEALTDGETRRLAELLEKNDQGYATNNPANRPTLEEVEETDRLLQRHRDHGTVSHNPGPLTPEEADRLAELSKKSREGTISSEERVQQLNLLAQERQLGKDDTIAANPTGIPGQRENSIASEPLGEVRVPRAVWNPTTAFELANDEPQSAAPLTEEEKRTLLNYDPLIATPEQQADHESLQRRLEAQPRQGEKVADDPPTEVPCNRNLEPCDTLLSQKESETPALAPTPQPRPDGRPPASGIEEQSGICFASAANSSERLYLVNRGYRCDATGVGSYSCTLTKGADGCAPYFNPLPPLPPIQAAPQPPRPATPGAQPTPRPTQPGGTPTVSPETPPATVPATPSQPQQPVLTSKPPLYDSQGNPCTDTNHPNYPFANQIECRTVKPVPLPWQTGSNRITTSQLPVIAPNIPQQDRLYVPSYQGSVVAAIEQSGGRCFAVATNMNQHAYLSALRYTCWGNGYPQSCGKPDTGIVNSCTSAR